MKKNMFFLLLLVVICVVWFLFFDESRFLCALSFVPPFAIWFVIRVICFVCKRSTDKSFDRSFFDLIKADNEIDEFDRSLRELNEKKGKQAYKKGRANDGATFFDF